MGVQVEEGGKSERCPVMGQIGIEPMATSSRAKASRLLPGLSMQETDANLLEKEEA
jgi:hypothetical protein